MTSKKNSSYKAAVIQAASNPTDTLASAQKAASLIEQAAKAGARLAVFPEAFLGGYPKGNSFGAPVGQLDAALGGVAAGEDGVQL